MLASLLSPSSWLCLVRQVYIKKKGVYLRFLYRCSPSIVCTYSNPASISCDASFGSLAILQVNWSFSARNSACSMFM